MFRRQVHGMTILYCFHVFPCFELLRFELGGFETGGFGYCMVGYCEVEVVFVPEVTFFFFRARARGFMARFTRFGRFLSL